MNLFEITLSISIGVLCICMLLILIRFIKGPSLPDRIISLDVFSSTLLGLLAIYSVISGIQAYLDVAIILSLVTFMGTMAFAYYLTYKDQKDKS